MGYVWAHQQTNRSLLRKTLSTDKWTGWPAEKILTMLLAESG